MKRARFVPLALTLVGALFALSGPATPQEPLPAEEPDPTDRLVGAIEALEGRAFAVRGSATGAQQEVGPGGGMIVFNQAAGMLPPYEGSFEAWTDGKGTFLAASERALPGFECWRARGKRIDRLTFGEEPFSVDRLMNDVGALADMGNLRRYVRQTDFRSRRDGVTGHTTLSGELNPQLVPDSAGGVMGLMRPKILRVEGTFEIDAAGKLRTAEFEVVRSDPVSGIMKGGGVRLGPGGSLMGPGGERLAEDEGESCRYRLDFRNREPGPRIVAFKQVVDQLRGEGK